jgi:threonine/homoserine/homoserine lactone efflux protein
MMPPDLLLPLASFCLVSSITPGPNNMMLLASGATFGLRRTVPHISGVSGGCALMVLVLGGARARPFGTLDAAGFQWVNPNAWAMVLGAVTSFARPDHLLIDVPSIALMLMVMVIGLPCVALWAGSGQLLSRFLSDPCALRVFNIGMAALLVASIWPGLRVLLITIQGSLATSTPAIRQSVVALRHIDLRSSECRASSG